MSKLKFVYIDKEPAPAGQRWCCGYKCEPHLADEKDFGKHGARCLDCGRRYHHDYRHNLPTNPEGLRIRVRTTGPVPAPEPATETTKPMPVTRMPHWGYL